MPSNKTAVVKELKVIVQFSVLFILFERDENLRPAD